MDDAKEYTPDFNEEELAAMSVSTRVKSHVPSKGDVESGAGGQAEGTVHSRNGEGVGNPQAHGEEVYQCRQASHAAATAARIWYYPKVGNGRFCRTLNRRFSLNFDSLMSVIARLHWILFLPRLPRL